MLTQQASWRTGSPGPSAGETGSAPIVSEAPYGQGRLPAWARLCCQSAWKWLTTGCSARHNIRSASTSRASFAASFSRHTVYIGANRLGEILAKMRGWLDDDFSDASHTRAYQTSYQVCTASINQATAHHRPLRSVEGCCL